MALERGAFVVCVLVGIVRARIVRPAAAKMPLRQ